MSKKHTTLHSAAITGRKSPGGATSAIDVTSNHDVTTVGQPTGQTPNMFSIVDMTEKVVDLNIVDNTLLLSQRNTDNRPTTNDLGETRASPQQTTDNEEEIPFFMRYAYLVPIARSPAPESKEDEMSSSSEFVDKEFDKNALLIRFQASMTEVISKLLEQPTRKCGDK